MKKPHLFMHTFALLALLTASPVLGQIADINIQPPAANDSPKSMVKVTTASGDLLVIAVDDPLSGAEIWSSDGTEGGTKPIQDILPGSEGSEPTLLTTVGNRVYFSALTPSGAKGLWSTNGQLGGATLLKEFPINNGPDRFTAFNGNLYFEGFEQSKGRELWTSNGTAAGTLQIADINPAANSGSAVNHFLALGNTLYFTASDGTNGREIWKTDGVSATSMVHDLVQNNGSPFTNLDPEFTVMNNKLYFVADTGGTVGAELWVTDGTAVGAQVVKELQVGSPSSSPKSLAVMTVTGNQAGTYLYFSADDGANGRELFRSDGVAGAEAQVNIVKNIDSNSTSSGVDNLTVVGNTLFFTADEGSTGTELFRSTGRINLPAETAIVQNINTTASEGSNPSNLTPFGTKLVFTASNTNDDYGLYSCNATSGGATELKLFEEGSIASHFTELGGQLYFLVTIPVATEQEHITELWMTDGVNAAGTVRVKTFQTSNAGSSPKELTVVDGNVAYFSATDGQNGEELWKTDGTEEGTLLVKNIRSGANGSLPQSITAVGDKVFFTADHTGTNRELWITDGTEEGTMMVLTAEASEINPSAASNPTNLRSINGLLYFSAQGGTGVGIEAWTADPVTGLATLLGNIAAGSSNSDPSNFIGFQSKVFFVADDWLREATPPYSPIVIAGTSYPNKGDELVVFGNNFFFAADTANNGRELWKSNGTSAGTSFIDINVNPSGNSNPTGLTVVGSYLYFAANNGTTGTEIFRTTASGTAATLVKDIVVGTTGSAPQNLMEAGGKLFFTADNGTNGRELWVSSSAGTFMVKDIRAGSGSPGITNMRNVDGVICFSADDGINGREVWISDGTSTGTVMLADIAPQSASSNPGNFASFQGMLLFSAADPDVGEELRVQFIGPNIVVEQPASTAIPLNSTVNFGTVVFKDDPVTLPFVIKNTGINVLSGVKPLISGINASEFTFTGSKAAATVSGGASTTFNIKFTPKEGGPRTATLSILSNDADENPFTLTLRGIGDKDPYITDHPESLMRKVGQSATFEAAAAPPETGTLLANWKKGSSTIKTATGTTFTIPAVTIKDGGAYSYFVKGASLTAQSNPAELGVVEDNSPPLVIVQGAGKNVSFKVNASGNQLTYQWFRDDILLENGGPISGATSKTMSIKGVTTDDTGLYTCEVTNPGGTETGGSTQLNVFGEAPEVLTDGNPGGPEFNQLMPNGIVGGEYNHTIKINPDPLKAALTYAAKNLPKGLKLNTKTGAITGRPTTAGNYSVELTAKNTFDDDVYVVTPAVNIEEFPSGVEGVYAGIVAHNATLNGNLGGRLDATITKTGGFSGSLMLGTTKIPLKGAINVFRAEENQDPIVTLELEPPTKSGLPSPITLTFEINPETGLLTSASKISAGGQEALIQGWRKLDLATAVDYDGTYNFGLKLGDLEQQGAEFEDLIPQGWSFGTFKSAKGAMKIAGRTADGDKITCSSFVGIGGKVVFYQTMYKPLPGSLVGSLTIDPKSKGTEGVAPTDNTLNGQVDWVKPADSKSKTRTYVAGFGFPGMEVDSPVPLNATGAMYVKPTGLLFDLSAPADLNLNFTFGGLAPTNGDGVDATVTLNTGNKIIQDPETTTSTKVTINASTGALTGGFTLDGRKSALFGLVIKDGTDSGREKGVGFFTLPQEPVEGETLKTSPILGGKVELKPAEFP